MTRTHVPKRWRFIEVDRSAESCLIDELGLHPIMARLLVQRGIDTVGAADLFLNPSLDRLHDPFLLPDAGKACDRLKLAIAGGEKILVHGDYDGDGVTSAALWTRCLKALGADVDVFVPHRKRDGYDMRMGFVERARDAGVRLIVTTDCGIQRCGEVEQAGAWGIDVIVTDHHTPNSDGSLPNAVAVVNPHRRDSKYPFADLAGVGVAFRLCEALTRHLGHSVDSYRNSFLDLAAIGTITDVVPLIDENRIIVRHGLRALENTKKPGLRALLAAAGYDGRTLDSRSVSHGLGPRLNAASRIDETQYALDILLTKDAEIASSLARKLNDLNAQRREDQTRVQEEAFAQLAQLDVAETRCLVVSGENWSSGIVGLVASKIVERFHRPCIVIAINDDGNGKGSARSIPTFNIYEAIHACKDLLVEYGGHSHAAGISINGANVADLAHQINQIAMMTLTDEDCVPTLDIAMEVDPTQLNFELMRQLAQLEPHGAGNPTPRFVSRDVTIQDVVTMGKEQQHLRFKLAVAGLNRWDTVDAPWFFRGELVSSLSAGEPLDFCFQPSINVYNGNSSIQFIVDDVNAPAW